MELSLAFSNLLSVKQKDDGSLNAARDMHSAALQLLIAVQLEQAKRAYIELDGDHMHQQIAERKEGVAG
jgi:hypothetical protein